MYKRITIGLIFLFIFMLNNMVFASDFETGNVKDLIPPSSWATKEIDLAKEAGLVTENTDGYYTMEITREQFSELVVKMTEKAIGRAIEPSQTDTFDDTTNADILKAYNAGIVLGINTRTFSPKSLITREQIATMVYRAITYIEKEKGKSYVRQNENIDKYTDKASISYWAKQGVGILANNGIMKGTSANTLSPKNTTTIEQSILLIYRLFVIVK